MSTANAANGAGPKSSRPNTLPALDIRSLRKTYPTKPEPRVALAGVDLTIPTSQRVALLGPNGSGKSTLLKILCLAQAPDGPQHGHAAPHLVSFGVDLLDPSSSRVHLAGLGVVFQSPGLDGMLTIRENLRTQGALVGLSRNATDARMEALGAALSISDRLDTRVSTLSGGLARRADLARAMLHSPRLLLLDEPTTGLDIVARQAFLALLDQIAPSDGPTTLILCTHMMDEAERMDRVVMLDQGRIVLDGTPRELRASLGQRVLRLHADDPDRESHERALIDMGLTRRPDLAGLVVFIAPPDAPERLEEGSLALMRRGASFEIGPPSLADAFLAATGRVLRSDVAPIAPAKASRRRGRRA